MKRGLTWDDVVLKPQKNPIESRRDVDLRTTLAPRHVTHIPIIPSPMDTVIGDELAEVIVKNKGIPVFHRFCGIRQKVDWVKKFPNCFISIGGDKNVFLDIDYLVNYGLKGICIDVANAYTDKILKLIKEIKIRHPKIAIIAGTVATPEATKALIKAGATAIRVGIGTGSACITKHVTGHGVPQFTAIQECAKVASRRGVSIIADGGIRGSRDCIFALAAGANCVMIGRLFAQTYESAAKKHVDEYGVTWGNYRGQASKEFQEYFYGKVKEGTVPEGESYSLKITKSAQDVIDELCAGIRSGLTYSGAKNIWEFRQKAEVIEVTRNYWK